MLNGCFLQQAMGNSHAMELEVQWSDLFLMLALQCMQCINNSQILNPHDMFQYCKKKNIQGIKFIFIIKDELTKTWESLEDRFTKAITIPGTRSYHEFILLSENTIAMRYCSKDQEVATTFSFLNKDKKSDAVNSNEEPSENVKALDFVSCHYDNYW